jgi:CHAT domain-containing protein
MHGSIHRAARAALLRAMLAGALALAGCSAGPGRAAAEQQLQAAQASLQRARSLQAAQAAQDHAQVLALVRQEMAQPAADTPAYAAQLRVLAIGALGNLAHARGFDAATDEQMAKWSAEGQRVAGGDEPLHAQLRIAVGNYWGATQRPGRSLPLLLEDLAYQRSQGDLFQQARALDGLASAYHAMGESALRDAYRQQALRTAERFFAPGRAPAPAANQWLNHAAFLSRAIGDAADRRDAAAIDVLWLRQQAIAQQWLTPVAATYVQTAKQYVVAGAPARAEQLLVQARERWAGERERAAAQAPGMEGDFVCLQAMIATARRDGASSGLRARQCLEALRQLGITPDSGTMLQAGLGFETAGDDTQADAAFAQGVDLLEQVRGSFSVAERAAFFANPGARRMHWGRIRVAARAARAAGDERGRFFELVARAEAMRARQLGELVGRDGPVTATALQTLAGRLADTELVVGFTVMDDGVWVTAFGPGVQRSGFAAIQRTALESRIRELLALLGERSSNLRELERLLGRLSQELLAPILQVMQRRTRFTFVPDGALALLPPGLLSIQAGPWQPLGLQAEVTVTPALRLLIDTPPRQAPADTLWALADPAYPEQLVGWAEPGVAAQAAGRGLRGRLQRSGTGLRIPALPETQDEVRTIARLFEPRAVQTRVGQQATKASLRSAQLEQVAYLHLATHGLLAGELPGLGEPALLLAAGPTPDDALLRASEAEQLRVGAVLTVLSACSTGSGTVLNGEGVMSLSRAFLVAGSQHVLMSLWPVDSLATTEFMQVFYRFHRQGDSLPVAHRRAMAALRARQPHPMLWAPFVLIRQ